MITLDPVNAIKSIQVRLERIEKDKAYIREVVARYDGLKSFEDPLKEAGQWAAIEAVIAEGA